MPNDIDRILAHEWSSKHEVEEFISHCYDRQALMAALIGYAAEFMTHRLLMRLKKQAFRPFVLQGWPEHVDEAAKIPRLRKLEVPARLSQRVKRALGEGYPVAAPPANFGLQRVLEFLGDPIDEELLCEPITVGPSTEWVLVGKPIRIDPNSQTFSNDAITLKFWELEEVCDQVGAQYQRIRRLNKRKKLPPKAKRIPPFDAAQPDELEGLGEMSTNFEPIEVNRRTQKRINADADGFSADRFLAGEDAFSGQAAPADEADEDDGWPRGLDEGSSEVDEAVGVTTGSFKVMVDPRSMAEVNYGQSHTEADEMPALGDIEHTGAIQLDTSVLSEAKKTYQATLAREEAEARRKREREARARPQRPADRPITDEEKAKVRRAIALMDSDDRQKAFNAASYVAQFGERAVKTLGRLFPGRLFIDRYQFQLRDLPSVERHSPVLYALAQLGEPALKVARHYLDDKSNDLRFYATYLYTRLPAEADLEHIFGRMFDRDRQTRGIAQSIVASLRGTPNFEYLVLQPLRAELDEPQDEFRHCIAIDMLGRCRDVASINALIEVLKFNSGRAQQLAHEALRRITLQDLSAAAVSWEQWWRNQRPDYRDQWLVGALDAESETIRQLAWAEVNRLEGVELDYHPNYPRGQRRQAQQDLAVWLGVRDGG